MRVLFLVMPMFSASLSANGQPIEERGELTRLEILAEESLSMGDPEGAALNIGKAAMMASILAKEVPEPHTGQRFQILESIFRAREHIYRSYSLFHRSGEALPAGSPVCNSLRLGMKNLGQAKQQILRMNAQVEELTQLTAKTKEWETTIEELQQDFQCP